jgi:nitrate/nitrite-specific signal transduction histidine kinase
MIVGTTLVTVFFDLNIAVISFTLLFYLVNKVISPNNPIRDLAVDIETTRLPKEN